MRLMMVVKADRIPLTTARADYGEGVFGLFAGYQESRRGFGQRDVDDLAVLRRDDIWFTRSSGRLQ